NKPLEGATEEKQLTVEEYNASIPKDKTVLVDFGATWCPPCVKMAPVLDELEKDKNLSFQLVKIDGGVHLELMKTMNVESLPVFIVYKNGVETWRKQGVVSKEDLLAQLK
ncbi:MAG: thioredoxin family protein, partial [Chitinophagaceae bacterium]|nr:thioredoxin family protein [Chitinophagaceae bacterium]